jgi:O-antigen/teichoic acid export membrane protein
MLIIGFVNLFECFLYIRYKLLLIADQKLYIVNIINSIALVIRSAIQIVLIMNNFSVLIFLTIELMSVIFRIIIIKQIIHLNYPFLNKNIKHDISALSKRSSAFIHDLSKLIINNTDMILLIIFGNLSLISIYAVNQFVFRHLYDLMSTLFHKSIIASFGQLISLKKWATVVINFDKYEFLYYMTISIIYSVCSIMILPFVAIFTQNIADVKYVDVNISILFVLIGIIYNLRVPGITMINASGHFKETQRRTVTEAVINIIISIILIKSYGIIGLLIGTLISVIYRSIDVIYYVNRIILNRSAKKTMLRAVRILIIVVISILFGKIFNQYTTTWIKFLINCFYNSIFAVLITIVLNYLFEYLNMKDLVKQFMKYLSAKL